MKTIALPSLPSETKTYQNSVDEMGKQLVDNQWMTGLSIGLSSFWNRVLQLWGTKYCRQRTRQ